MVYLKTVLPGEGRTIITAATPCNMHAFCSICGADIRLTPENVMTDPTIWGTEYKCPACRKIWDELEDEDAEGIATDEMEEHAAHCSVLQDAYAHFISGSVMFLKGLLDNMEEAESHE